MIFIFFNLIIKISVISEYKYVSISINSFYSGDLVVFLLGGKIPCSLLGASVFFP